MSVSPYKTCELPGQQCKRCVNSSSPHQRPPVDKPAMGLSEWIRHHHGNNALGCSWCSQAGGGGYEASRAEELRAGRQPSSPTVHSSTHVAQWLKAPSKPPHAPYPLWRRRSTHAPPLLLPPQHHKPGHTLRARPKIIDTPLALLPRRVGNGVDQE